MLTYILVSLGKVAWIKYYIMYIHWSRDSVFNKIISIGSIGKKCLMALSIGLRLPVLDINLKSGQKCAHEFSKKPNLHSSLGLEKIPAFLKNSLVQVFAKLLSKAYYNLYL